MNALIAVTKALADETRVRIISALEGRELCVCQIIELLDLAPSTISKHLAILKNARLIDNRKVGRWMYYRLAGMEASGYVKDGLLWILKAAGDEPRFRADKQKLDEILKIDPEVLCRRHTGCPTRSKSKKS